LRAALVCCCCCCGVDAIADPFQEARELTRMYAACVKLHSSFLTFLSSAVHTPHPPLDRL
jgi:hypothetical protein